MSTSASVLKERREPRPTPRIQRASLERRGRSPRSLRVRESRGLMRQRKLLALPLLIELPLVLLITVMSIASRNIATYSFTLDSMSFQQDVRQHLLAGTLSSNGGSLGKQQARAGTVHFTARASQALVRINQLDASQYASAQQASDWSDSTCSAASMTETINAYNAVYHTGPQYQISDILQVENGLGEITPDLGMLHGVTSISRTVSHFGFVSRDLSGLSLDDLLAVGNGGYPVIVNFPPDTWSGGHLLIALGGTRTSVHLADSSGKNMQYMDRATFQGYWEGFAVVAMPASLQGQFQQFYAQLHTTGGQGSTTTTNGTYSVLGKPTMTAAQINAVLAHYHSPAAGTGQTLYDLGVKYGIDPAYAVAFYGHESTFGTQGEARTTHSLGNLRCYDGAVCVDQDRGGYASYPNWQAGFEAWYALIRKLYVGSWGLSTVDQIIPQYAPASDHNDEQAYSNDLKKSVDRARAGYADIENF